MPMNRMRSLPASDFTDPSVSSLPPEVRLTAVGLRMYADDAGREQVRFRPMVAEIYEHDESMTSQQMEEHLLLLDQVGWLRLYVHEQKTLYQVRVWPPVQNPSVSKFPPPKGYRAPSRGSHETFSIVERGSGSERASESVSECAGASEWVTGESARPSRDLHDEAPTAETPTPPSPFCSKHQPFGTESPCGACGTARMAHQIWQEASKRVQLPTSAGADRVAGDPVEFVTDDGLIESTY